MESFLEDLKLQVQCSLCKETMVEPKLLQCFHTFCKTCIKTNAQLDGQVNIFKCPQCDSSTELQELNDVEDLEISPIHSRILHVLSFVNNKKVCSGSACNSDALWQCLDCDRSLCDECQVNHSEFLEYHKVVALSEMTKEDVEAMLKKESPCKTHAHQGVEFFCQDCDDLTCLLCIRDCHKKHKIISLQEFAQDSLSKNFGEAHKLFEDQEERQRQEKIALQIKETSSEAQKQVKDLTKKLVKKLTDCEQQLLNEIQKSITKADKNLRILRHAPAAQEYIKYFTQNGTASEIMDLRSDEEDSKTFNYRPFAKYRTGFEFKPNGGLDEQVNTGLGLVKETFEKADPKMSSFEGEPSEFEVLKKATLKVVLNQGEPCDSSLDDVTIHFKTENEASEEEKRVTTDGQIEVTFTPRVSGKLRAEVQVHGNPVSNSPLVMDVKPQHIKEITIYSKLQIAMITGSKKPSGIAVNKTNTRIAVADQALHCIRVFNMDGDLLLSYGSEGSEEGQLCRPEGLVFLNETDLIIDDSGNDRICIVDTLFGKLLKTTRGGSGKSVKGDLNIISVKFSAGWCSWDFLLFTNNIDNKCDVAIARERQGYCALAHNGLVYLSSVTQIQVKHFDYRLHWKDQTAVSTISTSCLPIDYFRNLAINDSSLFVCDYSTRKVHKLTLEGRYIGATSSLSSAPKYIAVLNDGRIICTTDEGRVLFF